MFCAPVYSMTISFDSHDLVFTEKLKNQLKNYYNVSYAQTKKTKWEKT